jgi:hypothetical protein
MEDIPSIGLFRGDGNTEISSIIIGDSLFLLFRCPNGKICKIGQEYSGL